MTTADRITEMMHNNRWTIDRTAVELNTDTATLRWFIAGYAAESAKQQHRLDAIVSALEARCRRDMLNDATRPTLMRRTPEKGLKAERSDYCKNGHWLGDRNSHYISRAGKRMCYQCIEDRRVVCSARLRAAKDAIGTLHARGLRDVEIASITGISNASISAWRVGDNGITAERLQVIQLMVAITNDLTGKERTAHYAPHPLIQELKERFRSVVGSIAA